MTSWSFQTVRRMREAWKRETYVRSQSFSSESAVKYLHVRRREIQISPPLGEQDQSNALSQGQQRQSNPHPIPCLPPRRLYIDWCIIWNSIVQLHALQAILISSWCNSIQFRFKCTSWASYWERRTSAFICSPVYCFVFRVGSFFSRPPRRPDEKTKLPAGLKWFSTQKEGSWIGLVTLIREPPLSPRRFYQTSTYRPS